MERRQGLIVRHSPPAPLNDDLNARRRLSETVVDTLATLHSVDIFTTNIVSIGKPEGLVRRQVHGWAERWRRSQTGALDEMDKVISWLEEHLPPESGGAMATIVHNDFKLDNLMLALETIPRV